MYAVGQKLAALVSRFTGPISVIFFPHASAMSAAGDRDGLRKTFLTGTRIVIAIALPLTIGLIVLARPLLHLWVGSGFARRCQSSSVSPRRPQSGLSRVQGSTFFAAWETCAARR